MTKFEKAIRKIIHTCLSLKSDENLLILIDEPHRKLGYLLLKTALGVSKNTFLLEIKVSKKDNIEPPGLINLLMKQGNAAIIATSNSFYHSKVLKTARHHGTRIVCLSGLSHDIIERSVNTDFEFITEKSNRLADLLSIGKVVTLTTAAGTNIAIPISRCKGVADTGIVKEAGMFGSLPAGEAWIPAEKNKAEGVVVIDGSLGVWGLVHEPIKLKIRKGYVKQITGNADAAHLRKKLKPYGKRVKNFAELGIGTNPKAILTGMSIEDEKVLSTVHIGLGDSTLKGGNLKKQCHVDAILKNPTLAIDGRLIIKDGKLMV